MERITSIIIFHIPKCLPIFFFWWMLRKVFPVRILYGLEWGRWGDKKRLAMFVFLLSLKPANQGLLTPPLILHAPCQKWLAYMHACLWSTFTSGPGWCECDPLRPCTMIFKDPCAWKWVTSLIFFGFQCTYVSKPPKISPNLIPCSLG